MATTPNPIMLGPAQPSPDTSPSFPAGQMGAFGGTANQPNATPDAVGQNAGALDMLREVSMGFSQVTEFLIGIAGQFPGSAQAVRAVLESVQAANAGLVDIVQSVTMEAAAPTPAAPRMSF